MSRPVVARAIRPPVLFAACACVAAVASAAGLAFADANTKQQIVMIGGIAGIAMLAAAPMRTALVLVGWVLLLTYNRQYFSFDGVYGNFDSQGLYWIPADAALIVLAGLHAFHVWRNQLPVATSWKSLAAFTPFLLFAAIATLTAIHPGWAFAEWLRWVKIAVAAVLLQQVLRGPAWWYAIAGLGAAITAQSLLGALQVVMNTNTGLFSMFAGSGAAGEAVVSGVTEGGRARGSGTMVHPNILGPYLLFILPIFAALLLGAKDRRVRLAAGVVCIAGYFGLIATMSRLPIAICGLQTAAIGISLVAMRKTSLKKMLTLVCFVGVVVTLASAYFIDEVYQRVTGDLNESISFRADYNRAALQIWQEHPIFGIGLNNFSEGLAQADPKLAKIVDEMQEGRKRFGIRAAAPVHNLYLLVLAETGVVGLIGFLSLLVIALITAWKATRSAQGPVQLVCLGITIGFVGQYVQQTMDFSMWMDPGLFTFVLLFALVSVVPPSDEYETGDARDLGYVS